MLHITKMTLLNLLNLLTLSTLPTLPTRRFRMWDLLHPKAYAKCSHSLAQQYFMQSIRCPHRFRSQVRGVKIQSLTSYFFLQKCESFEKCTSGKGVEVFMGNKLPTIVVDGVKKIATGVWYTDVRRPGEC